MKKFLLFSFYTFATLIIVVILVTLFHPLFCNIESVKKEKVFCSGNAPLLEPGQTIKVMTWNVQFMAGKNYVFFYDLPDGSGPDTKPSKKDIEITLKSAASIIREENPDIVLLQEVDDGARRTYYQNQLSLLQKLLGDMYPCYTSSFYWKSIFVPHPKIMGSAGMKLCILSKFKIDYATKYRLPSKPQNFIVSIFDIKRIVFEAMLPVHGKKDFVILNTHLEAFPGKTDVMEKQVAFIDSRLKNLSLNGYKWIIGGDFNLLPDEKAYDRLGEKQRKNYRRNSELEILLKSYGSVPTLSELQSEDPSKYFTHYPNDPSVKKPDRTIDYIFYHPDLKLKKHYVRQSGAEKISDHFPVIAEFSLTF